MTEPRPIEPVKRIALVLWTHARALDGAMNAMREAWGDIDFVGNDHPFDLTEYYAPEMGSSLSRRVVSFVRWMEPDALVAARGEVSEVESRFLEAGCRRVNIDVGYLDLHKIVLASWKEAGQKIPMRDGVCADLTARYAHGKYQPFEWTFPDLKDGRYDSDWLAIRKLWRQARLLREASGP